MTLKLSILGLPGSGKSTVARHIRHYIKRQHEGWSTTRINDYEILYKMFQADSEGKFGPANHEGFDVFDFSVFDIALKQIDKKARRSPQSTKKPKFILIEFARNNYNHAFKQFSRDFLQNGYFLFLNAQIETCKQRIRERVANPRSRDDHYVSEHIFESYYKQDSGQYLSPRLKAEFGIDDRRIMVLENNGQFQDIIEEINQFIDLIFEAAG